MKLAITSANAEQIEAALRAVNGHAREHAFTAFGEIEWAAQEADSTLEKLGLPASRRKGAVVRVDSGEAVPNSYRGTRSGTLVEIQRGASRWYLTSIQAQKLYNHEGGRMHAVLTRDQDDYLVEKLRKGYSIAGGRRNFGRVLDAVSMLLTAIDESDPLRDVDDVRSAADWLRATVQAI